METAPALYENHISGETFEPIVSTDDSYQMNWSLRPIGAVPFSHVHPLQEETFTVREWELLLRLDDEEYTVSEGGTIVVPRWVAHVVQNRSKHILKCLVAYTPRLNQDILMRCFLGLMRDGFIHKSGLVDIQRMGYCMEEMWWPILAHPTGINLSALRWALRLFHLRGRLSGWDKLYTKYVNETNENPTVQKT